MTGVQTCALPICRRQWHLADDQALKYKYLLNFDREMLKLANENAIFASAPQSIFIDEHKQILVYKRKNLIFIVNFNPNESFEGYFVSTGSRGSYKVMLSSDDSCFGGWDRISKDTVYKTHTDENGNHQIQIYIPARSAVCFKKITKSDK